MKLNRVHMARRLRAVRAELGITVRQLADGLGQAGTTYYNWESEKPTKPHLPNEQAMCYLCDLLPGLTLDYLYMGRMSTMRTALAIRLKAREMGLDPDAADFSADRVGTEVAKAV